MPSKPGNLHKAYLNNLLQSPRDITGFIQHGANIREKNAAGYTLLHLACINGDLSLAAWLISIDPAVLLDKDHKGHSGLHLAILNGHDQVAKLLVQNKMNVNDTNKSGDSSIDLAAEMKNTELALYLIDYSNDIEDKDAQSKSLFQRICAKGNITIAKKLLYKGSNIDARDTWGLTALSSACRDNEFDLVCFLIENNADVNAINAFGTTPLILACRRGHRYIILELLRKGAKANAIDDDGLSILATAYQNGYFEIALDLIAYGADYEAILKPIDDLGKDVIFTDTPTAALLLQASYTADIDSTIEQAIKRLRFSHQTSQDELIIKFTNLINNLGQKEDFAKHSLIRLVGQTLLIAETKKLSADDLNAAPVFTALSKIYASKSHLLRQKLNYFILDVLSQNKQNYIKLLQVVQSKTNKSSIHLLFALLAPYMTQSTLKKWPKIIDTKYFKDGHKAYPVMEALTHLRRTAKLNHNDKKSLLEKFFDASKNPDEFAKKMRWIKIIIDLGQEKSLKRLMTQNDVNHILLSAIESSFGQLKPSIDVEKRFKATFFTYRQPSAIFTYAASLKGLMGPERTQCLKALNLFVNWVLEDSYRTNRYLTDTNQQLNFFQGQTSNTKHLTLVFSKMSHEAKKEWINGESLSLMDCLAESKTSIHHSKKGYQVIDTDHPNDLLLIGTEILGSCLHVSAAPDSNKGLLAYLLDGKNRALVIKDNENKIIARCILRLLYDEKSQQPVLFQEYIYPQKTSIESKQALQYMAIRRAKILDIPLVSYRQQEVNANFYLNPLISYGGPAPFEYVDAATMKNHARCGSSAFVLPGYSFSTLYNPQLKYQVFQVGWALAQQ